MNWAGAGNVLRSAAHVSQGGASLCPGLVCVAPSGQVQGRLAAGL